MSKFRGPGPLDFIRAIWSEWFTAMSGPLSVPAALVALWVENPTAKILFGVTAFICIWAAAYAVWKREREKVLEYQVRHGPSVKQKAVDELSDELSWAIHNLLNRKPQSEDGIWKTNDRTGLIADMDEWYKKIVGKLQNREVFTQTDEIHFDRLGFVDPILLTGFPDLDKHLSMLKIKFERLREIIGRRQP